MNTYTEIVRKGKNGKEYTLDMKNFLAFFFAVQPAVRPVLEMAEEQEWIMNISLLGR